MDTAQDIGMWVLIAGLVVLAIAVVWEIAGSISTANVAADDEEADGAAALKAILKWILDVVLLFFKIIFDGRVKATKKLGAFGMLMVVIGAAILLGAAAIDRWGPEEDEPTTPAVITTTTTTTTPPA